MVWKLTFTTLGDFPWIILIFIIHVQNCFMGATPMVALLQLSSYCPVIVNGLCFFLKLSWVGQ